MNLKEAEKRINELSPEVSPKEVMISVAAGAAITGMLAGFSMPVSGTALGVALGDWLKEHFADDAGAQEKAIDRILAVAAREANA